jgi:N-methylhydantoinase A/oxoprolinase/acetone carboxylase beta subunit
MPLAHMARQYPDIRDRLKGLSKQIGPHTSSNWFQYWFLHREPNDEIKLKSEHEHALIDLLREEPKHISEILECLDLMHVSQIDAQHLLEREIIGCSGLTPTDLLHAEGRFTPWDAEAATWALEAFCRCHDLDLKGFCRRVWNQMTETIVRAIVLFLSGKVLAPTELEDTDMGHWFVRNSLYKTHQYLETRFRLRLPIIGVGAPAAIFLKDVADTLQTELILPKHFEVANAVGAVAGTVMSSEEVIIYPCTTRGGIEIMGYYVQNGNTRHAFEQLQVALDFARTIGREHALDAAVRSGAHDPQVHIEEQIEGLDTYRIRVKVMGNPRLMR